MSAQRTSWVVAWMAFATFCGSQSVRADFFFGEATNLGPIVNTSAREAVPVISVDGLSLYFGRSPGDVPYDVWLVTRATKDDPWADPVNLGRIGLDYWIGHIDILPGRTTPDGLELYRYKNNREGGYGALDLWMKRRDSRDSEWGSWVNLGSTVNTSADEMWPTLSPNGLELYFSGYSSTNTRPGGQGNSDLWVTRRATLEAPWGTPENLGPIVNSASGDCRPCLSADGLLLFFDSYRPGGSGSSDIYVTKRASVSDPWEPPVNLGPLINSSSLEQCVCVSTDGTCVYYDTGRPGYGNHDIWEFPILPLVDFNGDGKANGMDVVVLTQHWGQSDPVCDIGPYAWGDGIVDEQDLFMLAEYLEKEVVDPTLVAHWALDETEGVMAADSVGDNDAVVMGDPAWQPDGGSIGGALAFDGIDDCIVTNPVPELSAGSFSILAWVKGGTPDEVIISGGVADWLYTNSADGSLMTALSSIAGNGVPLFSDVVITDGQWHRIGLVWDGTSRILLVDEQEVARDEQAELAISDAGLIIGAGATANRFFSGQIDDLRIYRRAVKP